jgi:hypothetical protein
MTGAGAIGETVAEPETAADCVAGALGAAGTWVLVNTKSNAVEVPSGWIFTDSIQKSVLKLSQAGHVSFGTFMSSAAAGNDATRPVASRALVAIPAAILLRLESMISPKSRFPPCLLPPGWVSNQITGKYLSPLLSILSSGLPRKLRRKTEPLGQFKT